MKVLLFISFLTLIFSVFSCKSPRISNNEIPEEKKKRIEILDCIMGAVISHEKNHPYPEKLIDVPGLDLALAERDVLIGDYGVGKYNKNFIVYEKEPASSNGSLYVIFDTGKIIPRKKMKSYLFK